MPASKTIDLRSDTVTKPTDEMRQAMSRAEVGDDVFGEDPTVNELERVAAERVGKEAAVFMPTGTMVNQAAIWVHSARYGAMVCEEGAHVHAYEGGAPALLSNVVVKTIRGNRGVFTPDEVAKILPPNDVHYLPVRLVEIENTHNRAGGTCWTPAQTKAMGDFVGGRGIKLHLDGARIFNSAIAQGVRPEKLAAPADSVTFCLSKGLSAPVGSLLCGSKEFVLNARRVRKVLGGGMRQAGILAAAGLVALETMVDRLKEDHDNARRLAVGISKIPGLRIDLDAVQTNIVIFDVTATGMTGTGFVSAMAERGVLCLPRDIGNDVRMVTHRHISRTDVDATLEAVRALVSKPVVSRAR